MFKESEDSIISGFPKTVQIIFSDPTAIIYYTTDGSVPDPFSSVYIEPIKTPIDQKPFMISAIAYYDDNGQWIPSNPLSYTWTMDNSAYFNKFGGNHSGVTYIYPGGLNIPYWYDYEGNATTFIDVPPEEMPILYSTRDAQGRPQKSGFYQAIATPEETPQLDDDQDISYYSTLGAADFNPKAKLLLIDSRPGSAHKPQVQVANSSFMNMRDSTKYNNGADYRFQSYLDPSFISGQHVKSYYNEKTKTYVAYYYDSVDSRWIKSISQVDITYEPVVNPGYTKPLVFQWNLFGKMALF